MHKTTGVLDYLTSVNMTLLEQYLRGRQLTTILSTATIPLCQRAWKFKYYVWIYFISIY